MSPEVARKVIERFRKVQPPAETDYSLTPYELKILNLLVQGENYKTASAKLSVSIYTISFHVCRICEKLRSHSRTEVVAKALRTKLFQ